MRLVILLIICCIFTVQSQTTHEYEGTSVEVLGQSGKARITRGDSVVTMQVDYLSEMDSSGNEVGKVGNPKHTIQSFATQDFTFGPLVQKQFQNNSAHEFMFETPINTIGKMRIITILLHNQGEIGTETETWTVSPGDVKWNIELSDWTFCNPCSDGTAEYIDVGIEIKGTKSESKGNQTIDLGDATLELSNRIVVDGTEEFMANSFPRVETKGSKQLYIFRFPKFNTMATYDPLLQMSQTNLANTGHKNGAKTGLFIFSVLLAVLL